jgi:transcription termination factor Rho
MGIAELEAKTREDLLDMAKEQGVSGHSALKKPELVMALLKAEAERQGNVFVSGMLEITSEGYGFLRQNIVALEPIDSGMADIYISQSQIRRLSLRTGDVVGGQARAPKNGEKFYSLMRVEVVNDIDPELARERPLFEHLTPIFPDHLINLETDPRNLSTRLVNLVSPIGRGQRGMIVSPPKAGKTILLKHIANAISTNPDIHLIVCLIGERPEEVTDMARSIRGEVISATFDEPVEHQTRTAELAIERTKRLVETGKDAVILLDGITRLTRAYNLALPPSGRTLSGGIDPTAVFHPKKFFGAARNIEEGGSLTIIATCLIDTGSRMDDVIYEEFKGTGNMKLHLDRKLAEKRIFPAIDIQRSSTRREELLQDEDTLRQVWLLRRMVSMLDSDSSNSADAAQLVMDRMSKTESNAEFLNSLTREL